MGILALALGINYLNPSMLQTLRLSVFDTLLIQHPRPYTPVPVKIVDIDDESLRRLGQWPWPRTEVAELITRLTEAGAATIALDIVFAEPDKTSPKQLLPLWQKEGVFKNLPMGKLPDHDDILAEAIKNANVVTGFVLNEQITLAKPAKKAGMAFLGESPDAALERFTGAVVTLPALEEAASGNGALNSVPERDGIIRRIPLLMGHGRDIYPSLSAETLRTAQGAHSYLVKTTTASGEEDFTSKEGVVSIKIGEFTIPTDTSGKFWIYYTDYTEARYIPAWKIFTPDFDASQVEGSIILVGTSAAGLKDIRATPLNPATSGVEVHAQALEQVLLGDFLERPDWVQGAELAAMMIAGCVLIVAMLVLPFLWSALLTLSLLGAAAWFSDFAFTHYHLLVDPLTPGIAIVLVYLSESLRRFITTEREKQQVRSAFSHYMSPALVERLAAHPEALKLGGEMREMTILFCDVRGFTTISEQFDAEGLTRFINRFLTPMTDEILSHSGTIDKYMGDAIMAFWNAPLDDPDHAAHGCRAALRMMQRLQPLNDMLRRESEEHGTTCIPVAIGIGLNTGIVCVGNMGSDQRFDYSVLGDDVNLASRLEGQSKTYGVNIVIGENTKRKLTGFATLELDLIKVKGKTEAVRIHTVLGEEELLEKDAFGKLAGSHAAFLQSFRAQRWDEAKKHIEKCRALLGDLPIEGLYDLYEERIAEYEKNPPPKDWDGVYVATSK